MYGVYLNNILGNPTEIPCSNLSENVKKFNKFQMYLMPIMIVAILLSTALSIYLAATVHANVNTTAQGGALVSITRSISEQKIAATVLAWLLWVFLVVAIALYAASVPKPPPTQKEAASGPA